VKELQRRYEAPRWLAEPDDQGLRALAPYADRRYPCLTAGERCGQLVRIKGTALLLVAYLGFTIFSFVDAPAFGALYIAMGSMLLLSVYSLLSPRVVDPDQDPRRFPTRAGRVALDQPRRLLAKRLELTDEEALHGVSVGEREGQIVVARLHYTPCDVNVHRDDVDSRQGWRKFRVTISDERGFAPEKWLEANQYQQELIDKVASEITAARNYALATAQKRDLATDAGQQQYELEQTVSLLREQTHANV
jgi:hypothetical protein